MSEFEENFEKNLITIRIKIAEKKQELLKLEEELGSLIATEAMLKIKEENRQSITLSPETYILVGKHYGNKFYSTGEETGVMARYGTKQIMVSSKNYEI